MHDHCHYVPILKGKAGELEALAVLSDATSARLTPLIEIVPVERPTGARKLVEDLKKANVRQLFIDPRWVATSGALVESIFGLCRDAGLRIVPVYTPEQPPDVHAAIRATVAADGRGACLRLGADIDPTRVLEIARDALRILNLGTGDIDLILDFQEVGRSRFVRDLRSARELLAAFATAGVWRSVTWAATAFPDTLSEVPAASVRTIERTEWAMWQELVRLSGDLPCVPAFGDYGIAHPSLPSFDPKKMKLSASVRYTADDRWVIWKGRNLKAHGSEQFNAIAKLITADEAYKGASFSWGDRFVQRCAMGGPSGNHKLWRKAGTSHHLELVSEQLASLPGLSAVA